MNKRSADKPIKLGVFMSHPTQHHSVLYKLLSQQSDIKLKIYYYDPGSLRGYFDKGFGKAVSWDVDLLSGTDSTILPNLFKTKKLSSFRQLNGGIFKAMRREKFDAVWLLGYASPSNWLAMVAAKLFRIPVFYQSDTNILDVQRKKPSRLKSALRKTFVRGVHTCFVIGDKNKETCLQLGIAPERMVWCPVPVDGSRYEQARNAPDLAVRLAELRKHYNIPQNGHIIAFCGKLIPRKRPQDIIAALRILGRDDVYGLLIGAGPLEESLKESLTPQDNIRITGFVNQSTIPDHMLAADLAVVPSEQDAHPIVTTEYAMCGLPIIASHFCGMWGDHDILRPGENGFVYQCGDVAELAGQVATILDDDALRERMKQRSLELSQEQSAEHAARVVSGELRKLKGKVA